MRAVFLIGILCAGCLQDQPPSSPAAAPAVPASPGPVSTPAQPTAARSDSTLGPFTVDRRQYVIQLWMQRHLADEHVLRYTIEDIAGRVQFEEKFDSAEVDPSGLIWTVQLTPVVVTGDRGSALFVWYETVPSAPGSGASLNVFDVVGGKLLPLTDKPITVYGDFGDLQSGDRLEVGVWAMNYNVIVPLSIDLASCNRMRTACVQIIPGTHAGGLGLFKTDAEPRAIESASRVELFDGPEGKSLGEVAVSPQSSVTVIEAAADPFFDEDEKVLKLDVRRAWLHVSIDGREGWLRDPDALRRIGLPDFG